MNPGQITCTSCKAVFSVAADATSATCPGCGEMLQIGAPAQAGQRNPSKTLPLTSGPGALKPVPDAPLASPDPLGDDLPGMVEGEEIDMDFFESAGPSSPPPADDIPEIQQMPAPSKPPPSPLGLPAPASLPPPIPPPQEPPRDDGDDGVLGKIALSKAKSDGSKPLPPLLPADDVPEAGAMPVEEREPVQATREESKPPPNILAGPATPPIKLPDQGIDVTIPLAPVEEVSRRDSGAVPTMKAPGQSGESGESAKPAAAAPAAYKQTGTQAPASASGSRRVLVIVGVAVVLLAAAAAAYFLLGN